VKLHQVKSEPQNRRISNIECRRVGSLRSVIFYKIDRIPYFDIRYSLFDILFFRVSFPIRLAVLLARGGARVKLHESNVIFVKFHTRLQSTDFVVVLVPYKILISRTSTRTRTKRIRLNRIHTPCASTLYHVDHIILQFLFRSDWTLAARGGALMKLHLYVAKSEVLQSSSSSSSYSSLVPYKILISRTSTRTRTTTKKISYETTPKWHSFFFDQTGRCSGQRRRSYETTSFITKM